MDDMWEKFSRLLNCVAAPRDAVYDIDTFFAEVVLFIRWIHVAMCPKSAHSVPLSKTLGDQSGLQSSSLWQRYCGQATERISAAVMTSSDS